MLTLVRQNLRRSVRIQQSAYLHSTTIANSQTTTSTTAEDASTVQPPRKPSSVPAGVTLKGINFLKDGKDPVALEDNEYPMWLWDLLDEKKQKQKTTKPSNRQFHRKNNRDAIKSANFMKDKKT
ncbi:mitochondrial ribosomal protein L37-domain-containing protein [Halteromyces radiatus]|uniref:mitochondrial ribosomal protein L37-domain-containing protein n=1 Tax=Halteromyces radiatus TaxID=101107 RepID=UPI002220C4CD|nr:mitochondrial ribosomal protein L37-domain-containing protein [Halteromyces radiatus]KAI8085033.1 mitochondrial ribosomal protein L37-domain-containing protein [Halteromyces radiatus]